MKTFKPTGLNPLDYRGQSVQIPLVGVINFDENGHVTVEDNQVDALVEVTAHTFKFRLVSPEKEKAKAGSKDIETVPENKVLEKMLTEKDNDIKLLKDEMVSLTDSQLRDYAKNIGINILGKNRKDIEKEIIEINRNGK